MNTQEIWKDIDGFEGLYQVSSEGRVKSLNFRLTKKEKIMKPNLIQNLFFNTPLMEFLSKNGLRPARQEETDFIKEISQLAALEN